ncbi:tRNAse Z4 [Abeliophyllum distichum]|uniref:ribonuclease Z n=1 Tax=Abeliophyllum distichum TaxID=126358 RepID=A0ABD1RRB5_9LAMI
MSNFYPPCKPGCRFGRPRRVGDRVVRCCEVGVEVAEKRKVVVKNGKDSLEICRVLNGMWQTSGGWGRIDRDDAVEAMFKYADAGLSTFDMADHYHHTGLARILALRSDLLKGIPHDPLIVIGPVQLKGYLDAYQRREDLDMQFLDCKHTEEASVEAFNSNEDGNTILPECERGDSTMFARDCMRSCSKKQRSPVKNAAAVPILRSLKKVLLEAGLETLISVPVEHCEPAFGVVMKAANRINRVGKTIPGWKLVYSGDTRPCHELIQASCGAPVLIHEVLQLLPSRSLSCKKVGRKSGLSLE